MSFFKNLKNAFLLFFSALKNPKESAVSETPSTKPSHIRLLSLLQHEGRLLDFLQEDLSSLSDSQIGSAVRKIHADCSQTLEEFITVRPLLNEEEGMTITIPYGYDPQTIKVVGKVIGEPPYQAIIRHRGWKAHKLSLPQSMPSTDPSIISPAEVEVMR